MPVSKHHKKKPRRKPSPKAQKPKQASAGSQPALPTAPNLPYRPTLTPRIPFNYTPPFESKIITRPPFATQTPMSSVCHSVDLTVNGKCANCGSCCPAILPTTPEEQASLLAYAKEHDIKPELPASPPDLIYMQCPFLNQENKQCMVYPVRPAICQVYICNRTDTQNAIEYARLTGRTSVPPDFNTWELFNKTGLRIAGKEITPEDADRANLIDEHNGKHPIQVGRPVRITLKDGRILGLCVCLSIMEESMQVFLDNRIETVKYQDIRCVS